MSWLSSIFSAPKAPDPVATANAQAALNKSTAISQYGLNATNQVTPEGSLTYSQNGTWADGTPKFTATQSLSQGQQSLHDQDLATKNKMAGLAGSQIDKLGGVLGTPWNPGTEVADKLAGIQHEFLDPEWSTREDQMRSRLANQGITQGSEAYNTENRQFGDQRARAYDQMYLDANQQGFNQSLAQRNQPFNEFASFQNGTQIQNPNFTNTPQTQLSSPDLAGMTYQNYQGNMANQNAKMGGIFGLGAAGLGGWAKSGFAGAGAAASGIGSALGSVAEFAPLLLSDIRAKHDIERIGSINHDLGLYRFKYRGDDQDYVGVIAQEVESTRPDAVVRYSDGYLRVNYAALGAPFMTLENWQAHHGS